MKIYNQDKTQELNRAELNFELGYLADDKIVSKRHEAIKAVAGKSAKERFEELQAAGERVKEIRGVFYRVIRTYPNGGEDLMEITSIPAVEAKEAYDEYEDIRVYVPYTEAELQKIADGKRHSELKAELTKIKEDIEQETFGLVRGDYVQKKARAAEIINELRVLEGKEPREIRASVL